jgi:photosystem II stability/assembly factor-like uncharacterized protein
VFAPTASEPPQRPLDVAFWNAREGLLATTENPRCPRCAADIFVTRNGGRSWQRLQLGLPEPDLAVEVGTSVGWIASRGALYRTIDRGRTWERVGSRTVVAPAAAGGRLWAFAGGDRARLFVTRDGRSWTNLRTPQRRYCVNGYSRVAPVTASRFWFVCAGVPGTGMQLKFLYSTADGGRHWQRSTARGLTTSGYVRAFEMRPGGYGWLALTRGPFIATTNGGRNWQTLPVSKPDVVEAFAVSFVSAKVGYVLFGYRPTLRVTRDGGRTWRVLRSFS